MNKENYAFENSLQDIIADYKEGSGEPLESDEVNKLIEHLRNRINLFEGNITDREYEKLEKIHEEFNK